MSSQYQFMVTIVNSLFPESAVHFAQDSIPLMRIQSIDMLAEERLAKSSYGLYGISDPLSTVTVTMFSERLDHTHIAIDADARMMTAATKLMNTARSSRDCT
jgi:hypothetical protein